jgi:hypothetical protein
MKKIVILAVAMALALMAPSAALAQSSTCQAYSPQTCNVSSSEATTTEGTLPFTGVNVGLLALGGGTLLGAGLVVRRLSRPAN